MLATSIFFFFHSVFNSITKRNCHFSNINWSSASAFNLDQSKKLSFGKELNEFGKKAIDPCHPAQVERADLDQNLLLFVHLHTKGQVNLMIQSAISQK